MLPNICIPLVVDKTPCDVYLSHIPAPQIICNIAMHRHTVCEVHLVLKGKVCFNVEGKNYEVDAGQAFLIPPKAYHSSISMLTNSREYVFSLNANVTGCRRVQYTHEVFTGMHRAIKDCQRLNDIAPMIPWFFRLVFDLVLEGHFEHFGCIEPMYLIREYINEKFNQDASLEELAQLLGISTKQVQRIILNKTGHSFTQEVVAKRMRVAERLLSQGNMTNTEVARAVGYQTYTGFWKARKLFLNAKNKSKV